MNFPNRSTMLALAYAAAISGCGFTFHNPVEQCPPEGCPAEPDGGEEARPDGGIATDPDEKLDAYWAAEVVFDEGEDFVGLVSLALSPGKSPVVAFTSSSMKTNAAFRESEGWQSHFVLASDKGYTRALRTVEHPSLVWHSSLSYGYAEWRDGDWDIYPLEDAECNAGAGLARGLGASIHAVIGCGGTLRHKYWDGDKTKMIELVDEPIGPSGETQTVTLRVDSLGRPHVLYTESTGEELKYAVKADGAWKVETMPRFSAFWQMALTAGDEPLVCFAERGPSLSSHSVVCLRRAGDAWIAEDVIVNRRVGFIIVMGAATDAGGRTHLTYLEGTGDEPAAKLVYARGSGQEWEFLPVDEAASLWGGDIQVDESGQPWIVYSKGTRVLLVHPRDSE